MFAHAATLALRYQSHIKVLHCRPRPEDLMPYGIAISASLQKLLLSQSAGVADQVEDSMRKELEALAEQLKIRISEKPLDAVASTSWVEEQGRQVDIIKRHGRLADLIFVAKPDISRNLGSNTLKAALFNTGRPVMMCPASDSPPTTLCDNVAIAWNGSIEASRAVALSINILEQASAVTVLTGGVEVNGADSASLLGYLSAKGIKAHLERLDSSKKVGPELVERSMSIRADTLIMGAYSSSHEKETVFGGNTQYVVDNAEFPVVFVH